MLLDATHVLEESKMEDIVYSHIGAKCEIKRYIIWVTVIIITYYS